MLSLLLLTLPMLIDAPPQEIDTLLDPRERAIHLLSRFTFGATERDVARVLELGEEAWLEEQLTPARLNVDWLGERLAGLPTLMLSPRDCYDLVEIELSPGADREERRARDRSRRRPQRELLEAVLLRAACSDRQAEEVLCDFWRNHLNVSFTKGWPAPIYLPDYERTVIQGHVMADFPAMLRASARHPAMLHYLDNALSRRPPSKQQLAKIELRVRQETGSKERGEEAAAIAAQRGVNENYARELMELHTLGVDRTYRQRDVVTVAEALTGWGIDTGEDGTLWFHFDHDRHIVSVKNFLGYVLRRDKDDGPGQGERVLEILCRHEDTGEFLATKLVRYFVDDDPPQRLALKVAKSYRKRDGDLAAMIRTIVESDEFWSREHYQKKFKTPHEFVVSALRVTGAEIEKIDGLFTALSAMGQPLYHCDDPTGWYDTAEAWLDPGVLASRWQFALALARGELDGVRVPASFFDDLPMDGSSLTWMRALVARVLPGGASSRTWAMLHEVLRERGADLRSSGPEILGLILGSPEFQRQ